MSFTIQSKHNHIGVQTGFLLLLNNAEIWRGVMNQAGLDPVDRDQGFVQSVELFDTLSGKRQSRKSGMCCRNECCSDGIFMMVQHDGGFMASAKD